MNWREEHSSPEPPDPSDSCSQIAPPLDRELAGLQYEQQPRAQQNEARVDLRQAYYDQWEQQQRARLQPEDSSHLGAHIGGYNQAHLQESYLGQQYYPRLQSQPMSQLGEQRYAPRPHEYYDERQQPYVQQQALDYSYSRLKAHNRQEYDREQILQRYLEEEQRAQQLHQLQQLEAQQNMQRSQSFIRQQQYAGQQAPQQKPREQQRSKPPQVGAPNPKLTQERYDANRASRTRLLARKQQRKTQTMCKSELPQQSDEEQESKQQHVVGQKELVQRQEPRLQEQPQQQTAQQQEPQRPANYPSQGGTCSQREASQRRVTKPRKASEFIPRFEDKLTNPAMMLTPVERKSVIAKSFRGKGGNAMIGKTKKEKKKRKKKGF